MEKKSFVQKVRENNVENIPTLILFMCCLMFDTAWLELAPGVNYSGEYSVSSITGFNFRGIGWIFFSINALLVYLSLVLDKNKIETITMKNFKIVLNLILIGYVVYFIFSFNETSLIQPSTYVYFILVCYCLNILLVTKIFKLNEIFGSKDKEV